MEKFIELGQDMAQLWAAHWDRYLAGIGNTLALAVVATVIGCVIGLLCGILNTIPYTKRDPIIKRFFLKLIRVVVRIYVEVFRGTPMVLQAVFIYYGLPFFTNEQVMFRGNGGLWLAAIIVVSINTGAYMAESVRGGIISIDPGQTEGAMAIGMTHVQTMVSVILPQAIRNIIPQIGNNFIINIKDSSVLCVVGVSDLMFMTRSVAGIYYKGTECYLIAAIVYLFLTYLSSLLLKAITGRMTAPDNTKRHQGNQTVDLGLPSSN